VKLEYSWHAELQSSDDALAPWDVDVMLELWLRAEVASVNHRTVGGTLELRAAEQYLPLQRFVGSPEKDRPEHVHLSIPFKVDCAPVADMELCLTAFMRNMSVASSGQAIATPQCAWEGGRTPQDVMTVSSGGTVEHVHAEYALWLCEVWLVRAVAERLDDGEHVQASDFADSYFYVEVAEYQSNQQCFCHRVVPSDVTKADGYWLRMSFINEELVLRPSSAEKTATSELQGVAHRTVDLRLFALRWGRAACMVGAAQLELPMGSLTQGTPLAHFCARRWVPLSLAGSLSASVVGRVLVAMEVRRPKLGACAEDNRLFHQVPRMPSGVTLPLYELRGAELGPAIPWALESAVRAVVGQCLCEDLFAARVATCEAILEERTDFGTPFRSVFTGLVPAGVFEATLDTADLRVDLDFFRKGPTAPLFCGARPLLSYVPMLHWLVVRIVARLFRLECGRALHQQLQDLDKRANGALSGIVPLTSLREALHTSRQGIDAMLPASLLAFIEQWPSWNLHGTLADSKSFDYIAFFADLGTSGVDAARSLFAALPAEAAGLSLTSLPDPEREDDEVASVVLHITKALHLPLVRERCPNTFVAYSWHVDGYVGDHLDTAWSSGDLGRTEVIYRTTCPGWDCHVSVALPTAVGHGRRLSYPQAFEEVTLHLHIWHVEVPTSEGGATLIGLASVPLAPLLAGFLEVDGYFHITSMPGDEGIAGATDAAAYGQICVKLSPCRASFCGQSFSSSGHHKTMLVQSAAEDGWRSLLACAPIAGTCAEDLVLPLPMVPMFSPTLEPLSASTSQVCEPQFPVDVLGSQDSGISDKSLGLCKADGASLHVDVELSETELRMASRLSSNELAFRTSDQTDTQQLQAMRECHQRNMTELDDLQRRLLFLSCDTPEGEALRPNSTLACTSERPNVPVPERVIVPSPPVKRLSETRPSVLDSDEAVESSPGEVQSSAPVCVVGDSVHQSQPDAACPNAASVASAAGPLPEARVELSPVADAELHGRGPLPPLLCDQPVLVPHFQAAVDGAPCGAALLPHAPASWTEMAASIACSTTADAASQTEPTTHMPRKDVIPSLVRESSTALRLASQCQLANGTDSVRVAARVVVERVQQPCLCADTLESTQTPRTDASSDITSVATAAGPAELPRFAGRWMPTLDVETQRIARIMRGNRSCLEENDTSSDSCGE